ncbi:O-methyltransferase desB [Hyphodiscus hymeniophilus]|uniref:O-methyltransferase desB n=1 Tax=Hyphodiscus hymeniophilus TaxID=353542 RepID=A0A9P6VMB0_9HELO|nr:O-methyltransferase desB [Hyphodiscus hymeniophilus]
MLTATGITVETGTHHYVLSRLGLLLQEKKYQSMMIVAFDVHLPSMMKTPSFLASTGWKNPDDASKAPFQLGHNTDKTIFGLFAEKPQLVEHFNAALSAVSDAGVYNAVLETPWNDIIGRVDSGEVAMVDVGGADGHVLRQVLELYPDLGGRFILQDLPDTIAKVSVDLNKRIEVTTHDFFTPQPVKGARVYHYRMIFHDWPIDDCRRILRNLKPSMKAGYSKLLIGDSVVPESGASLHQSLIDMTMMTIGAEEKNETQFRELLTSEGFSIVNIWRSKYAIDSIIEAEMAI